MIRRIAKLVARRYLETEFTDIEELEGIPTYRDHEGPGEEGEDARVTPEPPMGVTEWTGGGPSWMRPDVPEDIVR